MLEKGYVQSKTPCSLDAGRLIPLFFGRVPHINIHPHMYNIYHVLHNIGIFTDKTLVYPWITLASVQTRGHVPLRFSKPHLLELRQHPACLTPAPAGLKPEKVEKRTST